MAWLCAQAAGTARSGSGPKSSCISLFIYLTSPKSYACPSGRSPFLLIPVPLSLVVSLVHNMPLLLTCEPTTRTTMEVDASSRSLLFP